MRNDIHPICFLLIADEMFYRCNNTISLNSLDRLSTAPRLKHRVRPETFPIPSPSRLPANWTNNWTKLDVDTLSSGLCTQSNSSRICQSFVPSSTNCDSCWKSSNVVRGTYAQGGILQAETWDPKSKRRACV